MSIPDKAAETAEVHFKKAHLIWPHEDVQMGNYGFTHIGTLREVIDQTLKAAAGAMYAQALRDAANAYEKAMDDDNMHTSTWSFLRQRADEIGGRQ